MLFSLEPRTLRLRLEPNSGPELIHDPRTFFPVCLFGSCRVGGFRFICKYSSFKLFSLQVRRRRSRSRPRRRRLHCRFTLLFMPELCSRGTGVWPSFGPRGNECAKNIL